MLCRLKMRGRLKDSPRFDEDAVDQPLLNSIAARFTSVSTPRRNRRGYLSPVWPTSGWIVAHDCDLGVQTLSSGSASPRG